MVTRKSVSDEEREHLVANMRKEHQERQSGYREQALKLFPWVCARCTREFDGKNLRELTVHHVDHDHDNNPPDGSNWELLCLYCHDHEHTRSIQADRSGIDENGRTAESSLSHSPFADRLKELQKKSGQ